MIYLNGVKLEEQVHGFMRNNLEIKMEFLWPFCLLRKGERRWGWCCLSLLLLLLEESNKGSEKYQECIIRPVNVK